MADNIVQVSDGNFDSEVLKNGTPTLVDFWAPWCGPCRMIAPAVEELAKKYEGKIRVAKMNVDENPDIPSRFGIMSIPTLIMFKDGKAFDQVVGAVPRPALEKLFQKAL